jgi:DNA-binding IclR family transcriptional regulator
MESAQRISSVLLEFASGEPTLGVSEIARRLSLPKSAVHRTVTALCGTGLLRRESQAARYRLGPRALELGLTAIGHLDVRSTALTALTELTARTRETTTLSLRAGRQRFYAAQVESPQDIRMTVEIGRRCPLYAGASGRAILAFLDEAEIEEYLAATPLTALTPATITDPVRLRAQLDAVRKAGYASSAGERDAWAAGVAAPVRGREAQVVGSISVCGPLGRFSAAVVRQHGEAVKAAAAQLSAELAA